MGWLHSASLLRVLLAYCLVAVQVKGNEYDSTALGTATKNPHQNVQSSNGYNYSTYGKTTTVQPIADERISNGSYRMADLVPNTNEIPHHNVQLPNSYSSWQQSYQCRESNQFYDCIFHAVIIDRNTSRVKFGHENIALNNQKKITFYNSTMRKLPVTLLQSFREIEELDLKNLQIAEIETYALAHGANIKKIDLSFNVIRRLPSTAFHNMSSLEELMLDRNELTSLPSRIFSGTHNLYALSIANNKLKEIYDHTFENVRLQNLILADNKLKHINLSLIRSLFYGNVTSNQLTTLSIPEAVEILDASNNRINAVNGPKNVYLHRLYLQRNNLSDIEWLFNYPALVVVDLSYNELETITSQRFTKMQSLERLYLSNNRLVQLKLNNNPIRSLKVLDIRHNYLLYVESNHKQFDTLEELYLDHNSIVTLKLSTNNKLRSLTLSNNDWDCKNLERLFEKVNRSVVGDSDRSCKQDYQLEHDLCCKVSAKPYLDRLVQYNVFASIVAKNQRAEGRCSANDTITRLQHLDSFVITKKELLQGTSQREAEINQLQNEIAQIEQNKSRFDQLHNDLRTEIDHNLRRYRVTKDGLVHPKANLRKLFKHLKSRRTFKEEETQSRILDAQRKMQDVETMIQANADLQNKLERKKANLTELKRNIKQRENAVKRLEAKYNNNPETRRITK